MKFNFLFIALMALFITSCGDDDSDNSKSLVGTWTRVAIMNQSGEDIILSCQKDDAFRLNQDGTGSLYNNNTNCNAFNPYGSFTWKELNSGANLQVNYNGVILNYKIQSLSSSELKLLDAQSRLEVFKR